MAELANQLARHALQVVCGPLVGGAFVAQAVAVELDVAFCWSERHDGAYEIPASLRPALAGLRVAVVDDAVNAGSAALSTAAAVRAAGGHLTAIGALVAVGDTASVAASAGVPFERLAAFPAALWTTDACPLCAADAPLDRPPR